MAHARSRGKQVGHHMAGFVEEVLIGVQLLWGRAEHLQPQRVPQRVGRGGGHALLPQALHQEGIPPCIFKQGPSFGNANSSLHRQLCKFMDGRMLLATCVPTWSMRAAHTSVVILEID